MVKLRSTYKHVKTILIFGTIILMMSLLTISLPFAVDIRSNLWEVGLLSSLPFMVNLPSAIIVSLFTTFNVAELYLLYPEPFDHVIGMIYLYFAYKYISKFTQTKKIVFSWFIAITIYYFIVLLPIILILLMIRGDFSSSDFIMIYLDSAKNVTFEWIITTTLGILYFLVVNNYNTVRKMIYVDTATGLPNGLQLERDLTELSERDSAPNNLALIGVRLKGFESQAQIDGFEFTSELFSTMTKQIYTMHQEWFAHNDNLAFKPILNACYRLNESSIVFILELNKEYESLKDSINSAYRQLMKSHQNTTTQSYQGGVTIYPYDTDSMQQLTRNLINLLYTYSNENTEEFKAFDTTAFNKFLREEKIRNHFEESLENKEFYYVFQPKIDLNTGKVSGYEALARWKHPEMGFIGPNEFIHIAEKYNYIESLTTMLLEDAYRFNRVLIESGVDTLRISVNLSANLLNLTYLDFLHQEFKKNNLMKHIEIEITESMISECTPMIINQLLELRENGISIAVDDFGTGYSNLNYLHTLNANVLKIDKSFIDGILTGNKKERQLIEAITKIAQSLDMALVAEGVEEYSQVEFLKEVGCNIIQGYYYSKPLEFDDAIAFATKD